MVGPVGFEPTTSAESVVYGYPHALPNLLISPIDGRRHTRHFILEPVMVPKRFSAPVSSLARLRPLRPHVEGKGPTKAKVENSNYKDAGGVHGDWKTHPLRKSNSILLSERYTSSSQAHTSA